MKIILSMAISLHINELDISMEKTNVRKQQYIQGIQQLVYILKGYSKYNIQFQISDNTTDILDKDIMDVLPTNTIVTCFKNNQYGKLNKGAGLLEVWQHNLNLFKEYDYIIHFEPRTLLISDTFFSSFFSNPRTLFTLGDKSGKLKSHVYTGLFAIESTLLQKYTENVHPEYLCEKKISIEDCLGEFVEKYSDRIPYVDVLWKFATHTYFIRF